MNSAGGQQPIRATVYSDASLKGWGGAVFNGSSTGGHWSLEEAAHHINYVELLAAFFAIKAYATSLLHQHVRIMIDNTAAVGLINNMGTCHSDDCRDLTLDLWQFCIQKGIWLTATHLPGSTNTVADSESRNFVNQDTEWMLNPSSLKVASLYTKMPIMQMSLTIVPIKSTANCRVNYTYIRIFSRSPPDLCGRSHPF